MAIVSGLFLFVLIFTPFLVLLLYARRTI